MPNQTPDLSDQDVNLLWDIVRRAQSHPDYPSHIRKALFDSYDAVFKEHGVDTHHDRSCLRVVLQLGENLQAGQGLWDKFEDILRDAGILLERVDEDDQFSVANTQKDEKAALEPWPKNEIARRNSFTSIYDMTMASRRPEKRRSLSPSVFPEQILDRPDLTELEAAAAQFDRQTLLTQALANWRQASTTRKEEDLYLRAEVAYEAKLKWAFLRVWAKEAGERGKRIDEARRAFLRIKYFNRWLRLRHSHMEQIADEVNEMRLKRNAFSSWNEELRVKVVKEQIDQRICLEALYKWTLATREAEMSRKVESRRQSEAFRAVLQGFRSYKDKIASHETQAEQVSQKRLIKKILVSLSSKRKSQGDQAIQAFALHDSKVLHRAFDSLRSQIRNIQRQELRADDASYYFLMTKTLALWYRRAQEAKKKRLNEAYKQARRLVKTTLLRDVLKKWHTQIEQIKSQDRQVQAIHDHKSRAILQNTFVKWQIGTSQRLQSEQQAVAHLNETLRRRYMASLLNAARRLHTLEEIADRFHSVSEDAVLSTQLRRMRMKGFEINRREEDADAMLERHRSNRMRNMLRHWADKARHPPSPLSTETTGVPPDSVAQPVSAFRDVPGGTPGYLNTPSRGRVARVRALAMEAKTPMFNLSSAVRTPRPR